MSKTKWLDSPLYELSILRGPPMEEIQAAMPRRSFRPLEFRLKPHDVNISAIDQRNPSLLRMRLFGVRQKPSGLMQLDIQPQGMVVVNGLLLPHKELAAGPMYASKEGFFAQTVGIQEDAANPDEITIWRPLKLCRVKLTLSEASIVEPVPQVVC